MNFYFFHLMPYGALDLSLVDKYESTWTQLPNSAYDPEEGFKLYQRYLGELESAEDLGFDGVVVNEHHQTAYGMMPSPVVIASALARSTKKMKIAIVGNAIVLRDHPLAVAEELAMIDTISGGRLICAFVRGIGTEYYVWQVNPTYSHERHYEAHDLILRAWTEPGPFAFEGKHYHFPYVNIWPRPYQKPHPPIWAPSNGSRETVNWASDPERKYTYLSAFGSLDSSARYFDLYRDLSKKKGWTPTADKLGWAGPVYIAKTDAQALKEAKPHIESFFNKFIVKPVQSSFPPGYTSIESLRMVRERHSFIQSGGQSAEDVIKAGVFLCGSPDTVRKQISRLVNDMDVGHIMANLQFGTMPHELTAKNMDNFAKEIIPYFKAQQRKVESSAAE